MQLKHFLENYSQASKICSPKQTQPSRNHSKLNDSESSFLNDCTDDFAKLQFVCIETVIVVETESDGKVAFSRSLALRREKKLSSKRFVDKENGTFKVYLIIKRKHFGSITSLVGSQRNSEQHSIRAKRSAQWAEQHKFYMKPFFYLLGVFCASKASKAPRLVYLDPRT